MFAPVSGADWLHAGPVLALVVIALMIVLLAENARIPVDDPNTHLELTMIHEVMVLDHSGPDFAFILYAAALKLWLLARAGVGIVLPSSGGNPVAEPCPGVGRHVRAGGCDWSDRIRHGAAAPGDRAATARWRRGSGRRGVDPDIEMSL